VDAHASKQDLIEIHAGQLHTRYVHNTYYFCPQLRKCRQMFNFLSIYLSSCRAVMHPASLAVYGLFFIGRGRRGGLGWLDTRSGSEHA